jgi:hypothetical protein
MILIHYIAMAIPTSYSVSGVNRGTVYFKRNSESAFMTPHAMTGFAFLLGICPGIRKSYAHIEKEGDERKAAYYMGCLKKHRVSSLLSE